MLIVYTCRSKVEGKVFNAREIAPLAMTEDFYTAGTNPPSSFTGTYSLKIYTMHMTSFSSLLI